MAIYSKLIEGLNNGDEMFVKVFTINPKGRVNNRVDLPFASVIPSEFPAEPSSYNLINTYTTALTFTAPEDGWYKIELFGASGNGGNSAYADDSAWNDDHEATYYYRFGGGGGGGGAYCCSTKIKLRKGDNITLSSIDVGSIAVVNIISSFYAYVNMTCESGKNGGNASAAGHGGAYANYPGTGGVGGIASGGNYSNLSGSDGIEGGKNRTSSYNGSANGGPGGAPGFEGGNTGGTGGRANKSTALNGEQGKTAFMKIYRGDTNRVA